MQHTIPCFHQEKKQSEPVGCGSGIRSFVPVQHCPMGAFDWRGYDLDNDVISTGRRSDNARGSKMPFLPCIILNEFSTSIVNMDGDAGVIHISSHAKPIIIPFEQSVSDSLLLFYPYISAPFVLANGVSLLDIGINPFHGSRNGVIDGSV